MEWNVEITDDEIKATVVDERLDEADITLGIKSEKTEPFDHWKVGGYHGDERYYEQKKDALRCLGEVMARIDQDWEQRGIENLIESEKHWDQRAAMDRQERETWYPGMEEDL